MAHIAADKTTYLFTTIAPLTRYRRNWGDDALARWEHSA
jgi:hypothetical protein